MFSDLKRLITHSGIYLIANIINRGGAFLLIPLYTRYMSVTEYGALELIYSFTLVITVLLSAGMSHATLRFYFEYKDVKNRQEVITTNFAVTFLLGLLGCCILLIWSDEICILLFDSKTYKIPLLYSLLVILFSITSEILLAYLRAIENSWLYVGTSVVKFLVQVCLSSYLLVIRGQGVEGVMAANLASVFIVWLILVIFSAKHCGYQIDLNKTSRILTYSLPFFLSSIVGVVASNMDRFFIKHYLTLADVGIYGLGAKFGLILVLVVSEPFFRAYGSYRFSIIENENSKEIQALVLKYIFALAVFVGLSLSLYSNDLIKLMAKETFSKAYIIVPFIVLGYVFSTATYCFQTGILYKKKTKFMFYISFCTLVVSVLFNFSLVPFYGALGAAISFTFVKLVESVVTNFISQKLYPMKYDVRAMSCFLGIGIILFTANWYLNSFDLIASLFTKLALMIIYVLLITWIDSDIFSLVSKTYKKYKYILSPLVS